MYWRLPRYLNIPVTGIIRGEKAQTLSATYYQLLIINSYLPSATNYRWWLECDYRCGGYASFPELLIHTGGLQSLSGLPGVHQRLGGTIKQIAGQGRLQNAMSLGTVVSLQIVEHLVHQRQNQIAAHPKS